MTAPPTTNDPLLDTAVARPETLAEAVEAVRDGGRLLLRGGGTGLDWGAPPNAIDTVVDTTDLNRVVRYDAADDVAIVEGGTPLTALDALAQEHPSGPRLAIDGAPDGATVGGLVARGFDGPQRLRYGPIRGLVIGVTVVLADGSIARAGGTVIKNVAGYDLMRLAAGSIGTLALIAQVAVRLHPQPAATATVEATVGALTARDLALEVAASALEPAALDWSAPSATHPDQGTLRVRFVGVADAVSAQAEELRRRLDARGVAAVDRQDSQEQAPWTEVVAAHAGVDGDTVARAAALPQRHADVAAAVARAAANADAGVETSLASHAALGLHDVRVRGGHATDHARLVTELRAEIAGLGGHVAVRRRPTYLADPDGCWGAATVWGPPPPGFELMRQVKDELDPEHRLAPGRFVGGL